MARHKKDYALLSATPDQFNEFFEAVSLMQRTQPDYSLHDLNEIRVPVVIVQSEHDEFIKPEHAEYLAQSIPNAALVVLLVRAISDRCRGQSYSTTQCSDSSARFYLELL